MKFGLHYLLSVSESQSLTQRYRDTLEQAVHAEGLGFESVWPVEQHFNQLQSALPCPTLLLAAIAARTTTLRLGTAIVQLPLAHPLRTAEEIATLDVLSGGRVEFGVGRGSQPGHFAGFGVPLADSRDRMIEALDYLRVAFTHDRFSFDGRFFHADDVCLVPKPVQRPHPPIRIAANGPDSFELAGRLGYPILVATHINPLPKLRELLGIYHSARAAAGHAAAVPDDLTILTPFYVGDSAARVRQDAEPAVEHFVRVTSSLLASSARDWTSPAEAARMNALLERLRATTFDTINTDMAIFDTPDGCVERIRQIDRDFGPGRMICWFNFFGAIPHQRVLDSMELFSAKVLPDV
jgi:alkanesulfonate monooxygenase SsuD/methylene tetrahydromethanopterin reductase-like flavin-dependent oxidoreductase (luciferase family)